LKKGLGKEISATPPVRRDIMILYDPAQSVFALRDKMRGFAIQDI